MGGIDGLRDANSSFQREKAMLASCQFSKFWGWGLIL